MNGDLFVVRRQVTHTYFSINHGNDGRRPSIVAFTKKQDALRFKNAIVTMQDNKRPHQKLVVENVPSDFLWQTCAVGGLDIMLCKPKGHYNMLSPKAELDDIIFHLENKYLYFS